MIELQARVLKAVAFSFPPFSISLTRTESFRSSYLLNLQNLLKIHQSFNPSTLLRVKISTMHLPVLLVATASALALAFPSNTNGTNTTSIATCNTQAFQAIAFETFQAPPGPRDPSSPEAFGASHISFLFIDPNTQNSASCSHFLEAGAGGPVDDAKNYYPCGKTSDGSLVEFLYGGKQLGLKHSFNCNG